MTYPFFEKIFQKIKIFLHKLYFRVNGTVNSSVEYSATF